MNIQALLGFHNGAYCEPDVGTRATLNGYVSLHVFFAEFPGVHQFHQPFMLVNE